MPDLTPGVPTPNTMKDAEYKQSDPAEVEETKAIHAQQRWEYTLEGRIAACKAAASDPAQDLSDAEDNLFAQPCDPADNPLLKVADEMDTPLDANERKAFLDNLRATRDLLDEAAATIAELTATAARLAVDANPAAIDNDEYLAWFLAKGLVDHVSESGDLSEACGRLKETVQTHLWRRMEEVGVPSRKYPELGVQFIQTHTVYPKLDRKAAAEAGLTEDEAIAIVMDFLQNQVDAAELIDTDPRVNWARMRGKEFQGKWVSEGYIVPDVIDLTPKPTVSIRKL